MTATAEWYRSPAWDEAARTEFEARLGRSRPHSRQQYLYLKGSALWRAGHITGARELLGRAAAYPGPDGHLHRISAWESLANMAVEQGDPATAEQLYRRILTAERQSGSSGTVEISLAEVLLDKRTAEARDEALTPLSDWMESNGLKFDNDLFRWHLCVIRVAEGMGDIEAIKQHARTALTLAERGPRLPRHPTVGLVRADKAVLKRLRKLAK